MDGTEVCHGKSLGSAGKMRSSSGNTKLPLSEQTAREGDKEEM